MYFCGFVTISTEECRAKDAPKLALEVAWVAVRAAILRFTDGLRPNRFDDAP